MQALTVSSLPIYLPYDKAPVPFGDPFSDATITSSSSGAGALVTIPGYIPTAADKIVFSVNTGATIAAGITAGVTYYALTVSGDTTTIASSVGGTSIKTTTANSAGDVTVHLLSNQVDGVTLPFKPNNSAVCLNLSGTNSTLYGAPDLNTTGYGNPKGPGTPVTIATVASGAAVLVSLSYDWIYASTAGNLVLLQN